MSAHTVTSRMISLTRIYKQYGRQILFVDASFQLNPGESVGLVGPNGSGKTTLFRLITGEETPDDGEISIPRRLTIGYFRQDVEESSGRSVLEEAILGSGAPYVILHRQRLRRGATRVRRAPGYAGHRTVSIGLRRGLVRRLSDAPRARAVSTYS